MEKFKILRILTFHPLQIFIIHFPVSQNFCRVPSHFCIASQNFIFIKIKSTKDETSDKLLIIARKINKTCSQKSFYDQDENFHMDMRCIYKSHEQTEII